MTILLTVNHYRADGKRTAATRYHYVPGYVSTERTLYRT